jgi:hypothetical protein
MSDDAGANRTVLPWAGIRNSFSISVVRKANQDRGRAFCSLHGRQRLPMLHLCPDRDRHSGRSPGDERRQAMSFPIDFAVEPELYEWAEPGFALEMSRRAFFRIAGGGVVVALVLGEAAVEEARAQGRGRGANSRLPREIGAWLHIGKDSAVTA